MRKISANAFFIYSFFVTKFKVDPLILLEKLKTYSFRINYLSGANFVLTLKSRVSYKTGDFGEITSYLSICLYMCITAH